MILILSLICRLRAAIICWLTGRLHDGHWWRTNGGLSTLTAEGVADYDRRCRVCGAEWRGR